MGQNEELNWNWLCMTADEEGKGTTYDQCQAEPQLLGEARTPFAGTKFIGYVDLSAKLEQWTKDSAIALSNGRYTALWVPKEIKQKARQLLVGRYGRQNVRYRLLAVLIFLTIHNDLDRIDSLYIDRDYEGAEAEATIKNLLLHLLRRNGYDRNASFVHFANVKGSLADTAARRIYVGKEAPPRRVVWEEVNEQIQKLGKATDGHKRRIA